MNLCTTCGACCTNTAENHAQGYVFYVEIDDDDSKLLHDVALRRRFVLEDEEGVPHIRLEKDGRCTALRGKIGREVKCDIYTHRARGCKLVQPGDLACMQARKEHGIEGHPYEPVALKRR
ncbi:MAG: hypothetical protein RLZZ383_467 [Pseudomonadota bacterium]